MKAKITIMLCLLLSAGLLRAQDSLTIRRIYDEALVNGESYENLRYLCKSIGQRISGSANAQKSVVWSKQLMESYGFDKVFLQEVMVPHWVRGAKETAFIIDGKNHIPVSIAALGLTVATPKEGITADVIEVQSIQQAETLGKEGALKGKIVFFNRSFDPRFIQTDLAYRSAGDQRSAGPAIAAKYGALGAIVRSLTEALDDNPHTGRTQLNNDGNNIPAAAISTIGANKLSAILKLKKLPTVKFHFKLNCQTLPDVLSYNVVGELTGTENPNKFITVGGHLDSWDLAEGARDDGTGVMQSIEVLRIFKAIGYRPKNSVRVVFFMNEENGVRGGIKYAELAAQNKEEHIAAIETDDGAYSPRGFSFDVSQDFLKKMNNKWKKVLEPYEIDRLTIGKSGTDIEPLKDKLPGVILIGLNTDSQNYFDIHHSTLDVFENVNKRELELGGAGIAALICLIDQHGL